MVAARKKSMVKKIPVRYQFFIIVRVPKYIYLAGQMPCKGRKTHSASAYRQHGKYALKRKDKTFYQRFWVWSVYGKLINGIIKACTLRVWRILERGMKYKHDGKTTHYRHKHGKSNVLIIRKI